VGAPSKFTEDRRAAVLEALRAGVSLEDACRPLAVSAGTVSNWLSRGRREQGGAYAAFAADVDRARAGHERELAERGLDMDDLLRLLEGAARHGSVSAAKFLLERRDREAAGGRETNPSPTAGGFDELAQRRRPGAA
jgi:hypothetical protein